MTSRPSSLRALVENLRDDAARQATELEAHRDYERRDVMRAQVNAYVKVLNLLALDGTTPLDVMDVLKWAERKLSALVTDDDGNGAFIRGTGTELAGFGVGMAKLRKLIAERETEK